MRIEIDYLNCIADEIGEEGFTQEEIQELLLSANEYIEPVKSMFKPDVTSFLDLPEKGNQVEKILAFKEKIKGKFLNVVVLGIGGSALGSLTLQSALNHPSWNLLSSESRGLDPRFFLIDNTDPELVGTVLDVCEPAKTLFIVISKSGHTAETLAAFNLMMQLAESHLSDKWREHFVVVTDPDKGWLRQFATSNNLTAFEIPQGVGGRFSVLTPVGLLPAALCGIDIKAIIEGAKAASEYVFKTEFPKNWAFIFALMNYLFSTRRGKNIIAMMPYSNALSSLSAWFTQLWAESLGKEKNNDGKIVNTGQTPVAAIGATDQHSQLQLYLEGPNDKIVTFIEVVKFRRDFAIPESPEPRTDAVSYVLNHTFSEVIQAELYGTRQALKEKKRPNMTLILPAIMPDVIGELLFGLEFATAVSGVMHNINPFDQPAVELGKKITINRLRTTQ